MKKVALVLGGHNATLVSHARALMAWGGFNEVAPNIEVTSEIGSDRALRRFWNTMKSLTSPAIVDSNGKPQCFDEPRSF